MHICSTPHKMLSFLSPTIYVGKAGPGGAQLTCWVHLLVICVLALCLVFTFIKSIPGVYALVIGVCVYVNLCSFVCISFDFCCFWWKSLRTLGSTCVPRGRRPAAFLKDPVCRTGWAKVCVCVCIALCMLRKWLAFSPFSFFCAVGRFCTVQNGRECRDGSSQRR